MLKKELTCKKYLFNFQRLIVDLSYNPSILNHLYIILYFRDGIFKRISCCKGSGGPLSA